MPDINDYISQFEPFLQRMRSNRLHDERINNPIPNQDIFSTKPPPMNVVLGNQGSNPGADILGRSADMANHYFDATAPIPSLSQAILDNKSGIAHDKNSLEIAKLNEKMLNDQGNLGVKQGLAKNQDLTASGKLGIQNKNKLEQIGATNQGNMDLADRNNQGRIDLADVNNTGRMDLANTNNQSRADIAGSNNDARTELAKTKADTKFNELTQSTKTMMEGANMLRPHINELRDQAKDLDKRNLFGPIMSRVRDIASKLGTTGSTADTVESLNAFTNAITNDPMISSSNDAAVGRFVTNLGLMASGAGRVHGGARGGGSIQMVNYLKSLLNSDSTLDMFNGRLDSLDSYMKTYSAGPTTPDNKSNSSSNDKPKPTATELIKKYGG